jgi:hypothetical protein
MRGDTEMNVEVIDFNQRVNNTLRGFITVYLPDFGMEIPGFTLHEKNGSRWIELPSKAVGDNQDPRWEKVVSFYSRKHEKLFKDAVLVALDKFLTEPDFEL